MSTPRSYDDACGIARALDPLGERWALLIVRELILGPKRFGQLRDGLRGASPNVLTQRLRELDQAGVLRRTLLPPPAGVAVYELTDRGQALESVLLELGRWGRLTPNTSSQELSTDALLLALKTTFDPAAAAGLKATYELLLGADRIGVTVTGTAIDIARGPARNPVAVLHTDTPTVRAMVFGPLRPATAVSDGRLTIEGDKRAVKRFVKLFGSSRNPGDVPARNDHNDPRVPDDHHDPSAGDRSRLPPA